MKTCPAKSIEPEDYCTRYWVVTATAGTIPKDLRGSSYWVNVAKRLSNFDMIRVIAHDARWIATCLVLKGGSGRVTVALLDHKRIPTDRVKVRGRKKR